ncbi:hypothetical protein K402DRAFT_269516 [Aulographum hederae CBS 113979]|uniref:Uncharacterized protein n=1 Tax=Aulographum hederae CBS 113979 TaxID=1176131 RepID=A0A6G1H7X1_9PEZI|nr:hypothetical protein K402DRAFT_269516 [Aulographum hederae CBS 113979]
MGFSSAPPFFRVLVAGPLYAFLALCSLPLCSSFFSGTSVPYVWQFFNHFLHLTLSPPPPPYPIYSNLPPLPPTDSPSPCHLHRHVSSPFFHQISRSSCSLHGFQDPSRRSNTVPKGYPLISSHLQHLYLLKNTYSEPSSPPQPYGNLLLRNHFYPSFQVFLSHISRSSLPCEWLSGLLSDSDLCIRNLSGYLSFWGAAIYGSCVGRR